MPRPWHSGFCLQAKTLALARPCGYDCEAHLCPSVWPRGQAEVKVLPRGRKQKVEEPNSNANIAMRMPKFWHQGRSREQLDIEARQGQNFWPRDSFVLNAAARGTRNNLITMPESRVRGQCAETEAKVLASRPN